MIKTIKGTYDILPEESKKWNYLEQLFRTILDIYNFKEIRLPIIEHIEVFKRTSGETSDIVTKEMFDFKTKGGDHITLRPEGTASLIRSYVEHKMFGNPSQPVKLYYKGPMFRYEQPQKGRQRQFHQLGVEAIGCENPSLDAEIIALGTTIFDSLGIEEVSLEINSLGDKSSREHFKEILVSHFKPHIHELCEDCKTRLETNPLRILDCKKDADHDAIKNAPKMIDYLNEDSKQYFEAVCHQLDYLGVEYTVNPNIVRGLDYYNHTVFEFVSTHPKMGSQSTLLGGGRYNGLTTAFDGPDQPGIGFGLGIERLLLALESEEIELPDEEGLDVYLICADDYSRNSALSIATMLRTNGLKVDLDYLNRSFKAQFKASERYHSTFVVILGEEELTNGKANVKHVASKQQETVEISQIMHFIDKFIGGHHHE